MCFSKIQPSFNLFQPLIFSKKETDMHWTDFKWLENFELVLSAITTIKIAL